MTGASTIRWWRGAAAVVVAAHGALHVMGFLLLWRITDVGEFTYDVATGWKSPSGS